MEPALHGREEPLRALRAGLDGALVGRGQLVVVSGEAGIGKSAIAAAIAREAEARGAAVTWGRAWEFADAPPYFPVWPCLRALGIPIGAGPEVDELHDEGHAFRLWERVLASIVQASSSTPVVWIVEDLHAADLGTLDLLTYLAQPLRALRVLVVATARADDPRITERMVQRLTRMSRDGVDLRLEPLSDRAIAAVTEEALGRAVPESALRRLADLTGGNPLFVVECARAFRSAGGMEGTLGSLPPTVRQVVRDRLALLPESTRDALAAGAVLGREFSAALVARMAGSLPARVIDTLLPGLRAGMVRETRPGHFIFGHTLVRDAIEDALGDEQRAAIHGRAEAALASLEETAGVLVERARHALAAARSGDPAQALAIADRAVELLEREGAFDRAFELHARIGEARDAGFLPLASAVHKLHVARIARAAGRSDASRRLCEEVVASARAAGDGELFARAALLHGADVRPGVIDRPQLALFEAALAALGESAPELGCRLLARLATALQPAPDPAVPMEMQREAIRRAHATGDDAAILDVLDHSGWGLYFAPLAERIACASELRERALRAGDLPKALTGSVSLALYHLEEGDFESFDRDVASLLVLSDELGHPRHRWRPLLLASARATMLGLFTESDRYVTEVEQLAALTDDPALGLALAVHQIMRAKNQRRSQELRAAIARFDPKSHDVLNPELIGAFVRATCAARIEDVETTGAELALIGARRGAPFMDPTTTIDLAEAYALAGTDDERRRSRDFIAQLPTRELSGGHSSFTYEGPVVRLLGLLDAALGDLAGAEAHLREARRLALQRRQAPWVAQTAHELARVLARARKDDEARALVDECRQIARELGMMDLVGAAGEPTRDASVALRMQREGDLWRIEHGREQVWVKDSRGMQLLARLVEQPGQEVHVLALASDEGASLAESNAGEMLDERARKAYRQRLSEIAEALAAAERAGDPSRAARLEKEQQALQAELARALGLGGRARQAGSATERARVNVQKRVKDAIARITEVEADLGRFLQNTVRTGTYCCFRP